MTDDEFDDSEAVSLPGEIFQMPPMRKFQVVRANGSKEIIYAHAYSSATPAGHLVFAVFAPNGAEHHPFSVNCADWNEVVELMETPVAKGVH